MSSNKTYSKKEISRILNKASEIQTRKDLYGDQEGLTEAELQELAGELGIDPDSLDEALLNYDSPEWDTSYDWLKGTSRLQDISVIDGEVTEEQWEEIVLEIRRVTGGIGKTHYNGKTHEWEQRKSDIGYKHFSLTAQNGKTKLQMVDSWGAYKFLGSMMGAFVGAILFLIAFKEIDSKSMGLLMAPFGGFLGFGLSRVYMKYHFEKQKERFNTIKKSIRNILTGSGGSVSGKIEIEAEEAYQPEQNPSSTKTSVSN